MEKNWVRIDDGFGHRLALLDTRTKTIDLSLSVDRNRYHPAKLYVDNFVRTIDRPFSSGELGQLLDEVLKIMDDEHFKFCCSHIENQKLRQLLIRAGAKEDGEDLREVRPGGPSFSLVSISRSDLKKLRKYV